MLRSWLRTVTLITCTLATSRPAAAQQRAQRELIVGDRPGCASCRIELQPGVVLGGNSGAAALGDIADVYALPTGGFVVTHAGAPETATFFDAAGTYVRTIGRAGLGPGEFRYALFARPHKGGLMVTDPTARRTVVFDPELAPAMTIPLSGELMNAPLSLRDGRIALNALVRTQDRMGLLVHLIDSTGRIVSSIEPADGGVRFDVPGEAYLRSLSATPRASFWVAGRTRYRLTEYTLTGDRIRSLERKPTWFPPHAAGDARLDPGRPKQPRLLSVHEDDHGRLWTVTRIAAADWAKVLTRKSRTVSPMEQPYEFESLDALYDTIVEVIDSRSGALLASRRFDTALGHFIGGNRVISFDENANGDALVKVWSLLLVQGEVR